MLRTDKVALRAVESWLCISLPITRPIFLTSVRKLGFEVKRGYPEYVTQISIGSDSTKPGKVEKVSVKIARNAIPLDTRKTF